MTSTKDITPVLDVASCVTRVKYYFEPNNCWLFGRLIQFQGIGKQGEGFFLENGEKVVNEASWLTAVEVRVINKIELYLHY